MANRLGTAILAACVVGFGGFGFTGEAAQVAVQEAPTPASAQGPAAEPPPTEAAAARGFTLDSPFDSVEPTEQLLERLTQQLVLFLDYEDAASLASDGSSDDPQGLCRMADLPGLEGVRCLGKADTAGTRTIELGVAPGARGGLDILAHGLEVTADGRFPNPDLVRAREMLEAIVQAEQLPSAEPADDELAHYIYPLSYTQADRALATLKTLGYAAVEYSRGVGEGDTASIYTQVRASTDGALPLPLIVKLIDSRAAALGTSPQAGGNPASAAAAAAARRGTTNQASSTGSPLVQVSTSEPQQRLLIVYDPDDTATLERLLNVLREEIDVPAKQVVIEALIVELRENGTRELGIDFSRSVTNTTASINTVDGSPPTATGLTYLFDSTGTAVSQFRLGLSALIVNGDAELLASPSVLVLDGRQAKIQIAREVPILETTAIGNGITQQTITYKDVGILLNLRPRVSADNREISLQVEANVSQPVVADQSTALRDIPAPVVESRIVQSSVRLANDTPFIIGGLIQDDAEEERRGVPGLSAIPILGHLFKRTTTASTKREVIIVLTPHVVPVEEVAFRYVLPKDSEIFDSFDHALFRDAYRIREDDVWVDLESVKAGDEYRDLVARVEAHVSAWPEDRNEPALQAILDGRVPGEEVLVRRMLFEVVGDTGAGSSITTDQIIYFEENPQAADGSGFELRFLPQALQGLSDGRNALVLSFDATVQNTLQDPLAQRNLRASYESLSQTQYDQRLREANLKDADEVPEQWSVLLTDAYQGTREPLAVLKDVVVMEQVITLNATLDLTLDAFRPGRQLLFPTKQSLEEGFHEIDRETARFFYEASHYYAAFQSEYRRQRAEIEEILQARGR